MNWWLVGLSFAAGLVLTLALLPGRAPGPTVPAEAPTTKIRARQGPVTTKLPSANDLPTTNIGESPTVKIPRGALRWLPRPRRR